MNITFFVGNGFDINAGLDTRYTDFIEKYVVSKSETPEIAEFKEIINKNKESWGDAELALGEVTQKYNKVEVFLICYQDFCVNLSSYLKDQEARIDYTNKSISLQMNYTLGNFYKFLAAESRNKMNDLFSRIGGYCHFSFVNFNYTRVLDNCIKLIVDENKRFYPFGKINSIYYFDSLVHIHGDLSSPLLLGVNDESQIYNKEFLNKRKFCRQFIKPFANAGLKNLHATNVTTMIQDSHIICIFGMSLGMTDKMWWEKIISWLKGDSLRHLIIYTLAEDYNINLCGSILDTEEEVQDKILSYAKLTEKERDDMRSRIIVAVNQRLFNFNLVQEKDKGTGEKSA